MGMPPGLPFFGPQLGAPQIGGSAQNNRYPAPGLQPYPTSKAAAVSEGLSKFMTNFINTRESMRQHYDQLAQNEMLKIQLGISNPDTVDRKKILGYMKKAGWAVNTTATPEQTQYEAQQQRFNQAQKAQMSLLSAGAPAGQATPGSTYAGISIPGQQTPSVGPGLQQAAAQTLSQVQPPQGPYPASPNPTLLQRLGFNKQPVSEASPMGRYLQQLTQASQAGAPMNPTNVAMKGRLSTIDDMLKGMNQQQQAQIFNLAQTALDENNPRHNDALISLSRMQLGNVPMGELLWAIRGAGGSENDAARMFLMGKMGAPQMLMKIQENASKIAETYGIPWNQALRASQQSMYQGNTDVPIGMGIQAAKDQAEGILNLQKNKPGLPNNTAYSLYQALSGNPAFTSMLSGLQATADQYPDVGSMDYSKWLRDYSLRTAEYGVHREDVEGTLMNKKDALALNTVDAIMNALGKDGETARMVLNDPKKYSDVQVQAAWQKLANIDLKKYQVKVPIPGSGGQTVTLSDPATVQGNLYWAQKRGFGMFNPDPYLTQQPALPVPGQTTPQPGPDRTPGLNMPARNPITDPLGIRGPMQPGSVPPGTPLGWNPESESILQYLNNPNAQAAQNWLRQQRQQQVAAPASQDNQ